MSTYAQDANFRITGIRTGSVVGGNYNPGSITADTWYRLMPHADDGAKAADTRQAYKRSLNLGTIRADITNANLRGWMLKILNPGAQRTLTIDQHDFSDADNVHVTFVVSSQQSVNLQHFPDAIQWVLYPPMLNPLSVKVRGAENVEFGHSEDIGYSLSRVDSLGTTEPNESFLFPYAELDRLCFRYATPDSTARLAWGEHYIV